MGAAHERRLSRALVPASLVGLALAAALAAPVLAATDWTIAASPTSLPAGSPTTIVVTVVGGSQQIGLITIVTTGYRIVGESVVSSPNDNWHGSVSSTTKATFRDPDWPNDAIRSGASARFTITVVPTTQSPPAWYARAYRSSENSDSSVGPPAAQLPAFTVTGSVATPTPAPTATPTATWTWWPWPTWTPHATPTPLAAVPQTQAPRQTAAQPTATATASGTAGPSASSASASPASIYAGVSFEPLVGGGVDVSVPQMPGTQDVTIADLGGFDSLGLYSWLVPGFFLGMPGLLILLVPLGQILAGGLILPLARRVLGNDRDRRRPAPRAIH
jgi:hypothetical protein